MPEPDLAVRVDAAVRAKRLDDVELVLVAEALVGRILKGQPLPRVDALVDLDDAVGAGTSSHSAGRTPAGWRGRCGSPTSTARELSRDRS